MVQILSFSVFLLSFYIFSVWAAEHKTFIDGHILFTSNVYKELRKISEGNFLVSPFSAEVILALAQTGAGGETAQELRSSLQLPTGNIEKGFKTLLSVLLRNDQSFSLHNANKIYLGENFQIKNEFERIASDAFYSSLENIDFSNKVEAARIMNRWVKQQTGNSIHDLVNPHKLDETTRMMLINALYFKGTWSIPFFIQNTFKSNFYQTPRKVVQVDTMHEVLSSYKFFENEELGAKFLEVPFDGENASVVFILPIDTEGLAKLENQIEKMLLPQDFSWRPVNVSIPKFKIESSVDFVDVLTNLGVSKAFRGGVADFSGISDQELLISDVLQKTFIDVNEVGVEAGAATYNRFVPYFGGNVPSETFHADHPFIFYIKVNKLILFAGRVILPIY